MILVVVVVLVMVGGCVGSRRLMGDQLNSDLLSGVWPRRLLHVRVHVGQEKRYRLLKLFLTTSHFQYIMYCNM